MQYQIFLRIMVGVILVMLATALCASAQTPSELKSVSGNLEVVDAADTVVGFVCADGAGPVAMVCYHLNSLMFRLPVGEAGFTPQAETYFNSTNCTAPASLIARQEIYPTANVVGSDLHIEDLASPIQTVIVNSKSAVDGSCILLPSATPMNNMRSAVTLTGFNTYTAPFKVREADVDHESPSTPTGLGLTVVTSSQIRLNWVASTDNTGVTSYGIERCTGNGCTNFAPVTVVAGTTFTDTGVPDGIPQNYRVRAADAIGNLSAHSNAASALIPDITAPTVPGALTATGVSRSQIDLTWSGSSDNSGGNVTYRLERCLNSGATACTNFAQFVSTATTSYSDTGRAAKQSYRYRVRAVDSNNNMSAYSAIAQATTHHAGVVDVMFVFDTSASMGPALTNIKTLFPSLWNSLNSIYDVATGVGAYSDPGFDGVISDLSTSSATTIAGLNSVNICMTLNGVPDTSPCGGDVPEKGYAVIRDTANTASWRPGAHRFIFVITDAIFKESDGATASNTLSTLQSTNVFATLASTSSSGTNSMLTWINQAPNQLKYVVVGATGGSLTDAVLTVTDERLP